MIYEKENNIQIGLSKQHIVFECYMSTLSTWMYAHSTIKSYWLDY